MTLRTYVHWNTRFTRFCLESLKQTPQNAGTPAISAYLDYLVLERNVAPATQKQALNAIAFLTKKVFGVEEFTLDHVTPAHGGRRPPPLSCSRAWKSPPFLPISKTRGNLPPFSCSGPACG